MREAMALFPSISLALVGVGAVSENYRTSSSAVVFSPEELESTVARGVVGDLCLRFFDVEGTPKATPLDESVLGISLDQLKSVRRCVAVAGGREKVAAIRGAMRGGWINGLITDRLTAEALIESAKPAWAAASASLTSS